MKTVAICIPIYGFVHSSWVQELIRLVSGNAHKYLLRFVIRCEQPADWNRNAIVEDALKTDAEYFLWVDGDNWILPSSLDKLIEDVDRPGVGVVTCLYFQKEKPYYPVLRRQEAGRWFPVHNVPLKSVVTVDACGMGACIIKREVFEKIPKPWFQFVVEMAGNKPVKISEDIFFSRRVRQAGFSILCDTSLVSAHYGGFVDVMNYLSFLDFRTEQEEYERGMVQDLSDFTGQPRDVVLNKVAEGVELLKDEWLAKSPKTDAEKLAFYKQTGNYLYDLANWHLSGRREYDLKLVEGLKAGNYRTVLDMGCGIGVNGFMLAKEGFEVTLADVEGESLEFARFRFNKHRVPFSAWTVDKEPAPQVKYDVILLLDVLEHLTTEQLQETVDKLISLKHEKTQVVMSNSFCAYEDHPMHEILDKEKEALIEKLLKNHS